MNKKEFITPFLLIGLGLVFAFISFAVFLSNGKSKKWIARKMKIGGLLLTLTSAISSNGQDIKVTCYDMAEVASNIITIEYATNNPILLTNPYKIKGNIQYLNGNHFSLCLFNNNALKVYQADIDAADGKFDSNDESFNIQLPGNLPNGQYELVFYSESKKNQKTENEQSRYQIAIKNE